MTQFENGMWEVLQDLVPTKYESSTHVACDIYHIKDRVFHVFFEIGKTTPMSIDIHFVGK